MSLYFAYSSNLHSRRVENLFYFDNERAFLRTKLNSDGELLFNLGDLLSLLNTIIKYSEIKKLSSFELVIDEVTEIFDFISLLSEYLIDKDMSIGLISTKDDYLENHKTLFDYYGVTYAKSQFLVTTEIHNNSFLEFGKTKEYEDNDCCGINNFVNNEKKKEILKSTLISERKTSKDSMILLEESFHEKFMKLLIESRKSNTEIYKKAGISRQVFSKIVSDEDMIPTKLTLASLCIGLELPLSIAKELMVSAGYSLSKSLIFDVIVMKYLKERIYDLDLINSELDEYGCQLLGWHPRDS